ncbi:MAG: GTP-binding protein [Alphaproteobacteria bacterium]|nr:GTP-binding protein [Alphaproteobacteria bacterium]
MSLFDRDRSQHTLPVSVITGFLGSGKTTLLRQLLRQPAAADTAVVINEFGEVGLDHLLVERVDGETVVLQSGCICCTIRSDLETTLRSLLARRDAGTVPPFRRIAIETTGLADPAPILQLLLHNPLVAQFLRLDAAIATVDAVHAERHCAEMPEASKQVAVADRLILTKTDIVAPEAADRAEALLRALNPAAPIFRVVHGEIAGDHLFDAGPFDPSGKGEAVRAWLSADAYAATSHRSHAHDRSRHGTDIRAVALTADRPLDWLALQGWLARLRRDHGDKLLRAKGLASVAGEDGPLVLHGVHHVFHPPVALDRWPDADRRTRLVLIVKDLDPAEAAAGWDAIAAAPASG